MCDKETNEIVMAVPKGTLRFQFSANGFFCWNDIERYEVSVRR